MDVVYRTPESLVVYTQPDGAKERAPFFEQPSIYAVDALVRAHEKYKIFFEGAAQWFYFFYSSYSSPNFIRLVKHKK